MNYRSATIAETLQRINKEIFIPNIQRPYVWGTEQIVRLFDSLMRGYPVNSFLFWELQPESLGEWDIYNFVRDFQQGNVHNDQAHPDPDKPAVLVLDGQQRLTSLLIGLTGHYRIFEKKKVRSSGWITQALFLDLLQDPNFQLEESEDDAAIKELYYGFKFFDLERLPKSSTEKIWFKVSNILNFLNEHQLDAFIDSELLNYPSLECVEKEIFASNLKRLFEVVWRQDCIAYYLEKDQSYDKVLDIFIRANDGGTKLSKSDLLMSMVTMRWERFNARDETEQLTYHLREILVQDNAFDRDYLLRSGLFFNNLNFLFQIKNFSSRNIEIIENRWPETTMALRMAGDYFNKIGITGSQLTANNIVMLIACYIYKCNQGLSLDKWVFTPEDQEIVRRWVVMVLFHGVLSGAANITMDLFRRVVGDVINDAEDQGVKVRFPALELTKRMTKRGRIMDFDEGAVRRFCLTDAKSRLGSVCLSLLYDRTDWRSEGFQMVQIVPDHLLHEDRLSGSGMTSVEIPVAKSLAKTLANYVLMTTEEATEYYSRDFEEWVDSRRIVDFQNHLLPVNADLYGQHNFVHFVEERTQLIAHRLRNLFEPSVTRVVLATALSEIH